MSQEIWKNFFLIFRHFLVKFQNRLFPFGSFYPYKSKTVVKTKYNHSKDKYINLPVQHRKSTFWLSLVTGSLIFPTSKTRSYSLIFQINRFTRTNQTMLSITIKKSSRFLLRIKIGQGWIRTTVDSRRQIYSLLPLATRPPTHV